MDPPSIVIHIYDALSGRELNSGTSDEIFQHKHDIERLELSQSNNSQRYLAFTDKNHDLFVIPARDRLASKTPPISIGMWR